MQHYDYRPLTEPELRFQAMQTLAFGGRGLLWYTYWYPGQPNPTVAHSMIDFDGNPTPEYAWIKSINADARALGDELVSCESWAAFHTGEPAPFAMPDKSPIIPSGARLTTGVFRSSGGKTFALVTNRDYRVAVRADARIEPASARVERFDPSKRIWVPAPRHADGRLQIDLLAGEGILLRWPGEL